MNENVPQSPRLAGGFFIAIGMLVGGIAGVLYGQPSLGMVLGLGAGILVALAIWLYDSKRR